MSGDTPAQHCRESGKQQLERFSKKLETNFTLCQDMQDRQLFLLETQKTTTQFMKHWTKTSWVLRLPFSHRHPSTAVSYQNPPKSSVHSLCNAIQIAKVRVQQCKRSRHTKLKAIAMIKECMIWAVSPKLIPIEDLRVYLSIAVCGLQ